MQAHSRPRVKICCISSIEEARLAVAYGAALLGLVSAMPSGPGVIEEELIARIAATVPPGVTSILLTSKQDVASIVEQQRYCCTGAIQLCDRLEQGRHEELRQALPGIRIVQVIHVTGPESLREAQAVAPHVHGILLDSGNQALSVKELGGTGRIHDWSISRAIREAIEVPLLLAGGLNAENVAQAVAAVGPFALDICSGVRTDGHLDASKLARLFYALLS